MVNCSTKEDNNKDISQYWWNKSTQKQQGEMIPNSALYPQCYHLRPSGDYLLPLLLPTVFSLPHPASIYIWNCKSDHVILPIAFPIQTQSDHTFSLTSPFPFLSLPSHTRHSTILGPLHWLFYRPGYSLPDIHMPNFPFAFKSLLKLHSFNPSSLPPHILQSFWSCSPYSIFSVAFLFL